MICKGRVYLVRGPLEASAKRRGGASMLFSNETPYRYHLKHRLCGTSHASVAPVCGSVDNLEAFSQFRREFDSRESLTIAGLLLISNLTGESDIFASKHGISALILLAATGEAKKDQRKKLRKNTRRN